MVNQILAPQTIDNAIRMNPRTAVFHALVAFYRDRTPLIESLEQWQKTEDPSPLDFSFAQNLAFGTVRMTLALDFLLGQLVDRVRARTKERVLFRMAFYQHLYLKTVPIYALVNEMVDLAKRVCSPPFVRFFHYALRRLEKTTLTLPSDDALASLSIRYSYPLDFVERLASQYGVEKAKTILEEENQIPQLTVRLRGERIPQGVTPFLNLPSMGKIEDSADRNTLFASQDVYVQNTTSATLIEEMSHHIHSPKKILDLCAAPGGKLLAIHDRFPDAQLFANDRSLVKTEKIRENQKKYGFPATITTLSGEEYPSEQLFDLIILDVPCTNTGVLHKRPEARWRLTKEAIAQLRELQWELLTHAKKLVAPKGQIWWMTCSILSEENEEIVTRAKEEWGVHVLYAKCILPHERLWDGGFGAVLRI